MLTKVVLKQGKEKSLIQKHPWLFSGAVDKIIGKVKDGDIVQIVDCKDSTLGFGFYTVGKSIICRIFEWQNINQFDQAYWKSKIGAALNLRKQLINFSETNIYRLVHAEGDDLPGLVVDIYAGTAVLQCVIEGTQRLKVVFGEILIELGFEFVYFKDKIIQNTGIDTSDWHKNLKPSLPIWAIENNNKFAIDPEKGQKTGFFIDQRENRALLGNLAKGKTVLNTFSYSGGFTVYALNQEAEKVVSVDISEEAALLCNLNSNQSKFPENNETIVKDVFEYLKDEKELFDIVILDPPAFAKNAHHITQASRGYKEINRKGMLRVKKGGYLLTFSCSHHIEKELFKKIIFSAALDANKNVKILKHLSQSEDHPISIYHPEGDYLKGFLLWVE